MMKKLAVMLLTDSLLLGILTGCGESAPMDELVYNGQGGNIQSEELDIQAGSSYVENSYNNSDSSSPDESDGKNIFSEEESEQPSERTFPTLAKLHEGVKEELGENYWPDISVSERELEDRTGITQDMYVEFLAEEQMMEANIDMMIIIHAKEDYVGAIEQALENYRSLLIEENRKYPQNHSKAEASRMETIENYVCFVQLGADTSIVAGKGEKEVIAYCQEENERAIDVIEKAILQ